jgi:hypothetical protein
MSAQPPSRRRPSFSAEREYAAPISESSKAVGETKSNYAADDPPSYDSLDGEGTNTVGGSGIRDVPTADDKLGFEPYVKALAAFLTHTDTKPPLTLSIEGPWGSGKSSFMFQLEKRIKEMTPSSTNPPVTIRFNAWRLNQEEAVWAGYATSVISALRKTVGWRTMLWGDIKIRWSRFEWGKGWFSIIRFLLLSLFLVFTSIGVIRYLFSHPQTISPFSDEIARPKTAHSNDAKPEEALLRLLISSLGSAGYLLLGFMILKKAADTLGNPFEIELKKFSGNPDYEGRSSFIEKFHCDFTHILSSYGKGRKLFVFIDDLDRCEIPRAAELMQAINLMFGESDQIVHILGLDRDKIAAGIAAKYQNLLPFLQETANSSPYSAAGDFGYAFLEKFIQLPFHLPRVTDREVQRFLANLNGEGDEEANPRSDTAIAGVLFETKVDSPLVKSIVSKMAAPLEYNPRRIKQFVNQFRLSAIIGTATGMFAEQDHNINDPSADLKPLTPEALGKLLVVSLRWPRLLDDVSKFQELFNYMEEMAKGKIHRC